MKKFKKGDQVVLITNTTLKCEGENWAEKAGIKIGKTYTVSEFSEGGWDDEKENAITLVGYNFSHPSSKFELAKNTHPLIITKQTKVRAGKKYFTFQFSKNKKVSNHQYNSSATRNKQLTQFLEDIKSGNYEIK